MDISLNPREGIEELIRRADIEGLLRKAGELHGHYCPYVALGVRAGYIGLRDLGIEQNTGMEEVVAIVETNNCFSDGIQMVTGCTFANNALIYRDLGKTVVTVATRKGDGVRVAVKANYAESFSSRFPEAEALFEKIVIKRQKAKEEEHKRLKQLWAEVSFAQLKVPEEDIFGVNRLRVDLPPYAPIFASARCSVCGESVMETRARIQDGKPVCISCASAEHYALDGAGISVERRRKS